MSEVAMVAVGVAVVVSAAASVIWTRAQKRRLDPQRDVLDFGTIMQRFYANSDVALADVEKTYTRISEATGVPAGALRPDDRFDRELKPRTGWAYDDPLHIFSDELARDAEKAGIRVKLEEVVTVDDALRLMKRIRESRARESGARSL